MRAMHGQNLNNLNPILLLMENSHTIPTISWMINTISGDSFIIKAPSKEDAEYIFQSLPLSSSLTIKTIVPLGDIKNLERAMKLWRKQLSELISDAVREPQ